MWRVLTWRKTEKVHFEWYEHGEKPTKFVWNIEKQKAINTKVRHLIDIKTLVTLTRSTLAYVNFAKTFLKRMFLNLDRKGNGFLNSITLQNLNSKRFDICESQITEKHLITALKSIPNGKAPVHDGLTKEN